VLRERAAELEAQLSIRRREHLRVALERPAPYVTEALGALPEDPRARRTWQRAATRMEAYRFDHAITDDRHALGSPPSDRPGRAHWQRAQHDLQRAQRDLGHHDAADARTRYETRIQKPPQRCSPMVLSRHVVSLNRGRLLPRVSESQMTLPLDARSSSGAGVRRRESATLAGARKEERRWSAR
jgi:hypothetical protein